MRQISIWILVGVGLFVVVVGSTLIARRRALRTESVERSASRADYRIKEVHLEEESGKIRWKLVAEQAEVFEGEGRTGLRRPVVEVQEPSRSWRVSAEEGDVHQRSKDLEVRRNVVLVSDDGLRLETSVLRWDAKGKRLWTDTPVRISGNGAVIEGGGLDVSVGEERAEVKGRVRARFTKIPKVTR
jgi:LPS export ABC transporter protein LptC